jgi:hypothetical protein
VLRMDQQRKAELLQKELFASFQKENMYIYIYILIYVYVVQCVRIRGVYLYMLYNVYAYVGIRAVLKDD